MYRNWLIIYCLPPNRNLLSATYLYPLSVRDNKQNYIEDKHVLILNRPQIMHESLLFFF